MEKEEENAPISPNHLARSATCEVDMNCICTYLKHINDEYSDYLDVQKCKHGNSMEPKMNLIF